MNKFILAIILFQFASCTQSITDHHSHDIPHLDSNFVFVEPDAGKTWNIFGLQIVGKILSDETNGEYAVIQSKTPPGGGPPMHIHKNEDELFYILEGNYVFICGDSVVNASKGSLVHLPRGIAHSFKNVGDSTGIVINTITPGGFENFFEEIDQLTKDSIPTKSKIEEVASKYNLKFVPK